GTGARGEEWEGRGALPEPSEGPLAGLVGRCRAAGRCREARAESAASSAICAAPSPTTKAQLRARLSPPTPPRRNRNPPPPPRNVGRALPAQPGRSPSRHRQRPKPRMRLRPNPPRRNKTPSRRKIRETPRACSAARRRRCPPAASTAASAPGTEDQHRTNEIRQRIVPSVRCRPSSIVCLSEPPVAVLVFLARAAGTGLVAANLAPA